MKYPQGYNTKRRNLILECFKNDKTRHYTADELWAELKDSGVSRSTIYRTLEKLVYEKEVVKYSFGKGVSACYRYYGDTKNDATYHFICTKCGAVEHLSCEMLDSLRLHLIRSHSLKIDPSLTILYGTCERCLGR